MSDTIVAISTPSGRGAIGIVRLSGVDLTGVVGRVFQATRSKVRLDDRRPHLGFMLDRDFHRIDEGLLLWMKAPNSYTGEDVVELHCHGNPLILEKVVLAAMAAGARGARAGEFTERAFLNGRLDLLQADAVAQVIKASSERSLMAARKLMEGEVSEEIEALRGELLGALKWLEMEIDFPEEEVSFDTDSVLASLEGLRGRIASMVLAYKRSRPVREGYRVALCGVPNVGKSSLLNALVGRRRSIVAAEPGTTRDMVEAPIDIGGWTVWLQDTAGLRSARCEVEEEGVRLTTEVMRSADLVLFVVDGSGQLSDADIEVWTSIEESGVEWFGVVNKCDLGINLRVSELGGTWFEVSAKSGLGIGSVLDAVANWIRGNDGSEQTLLMSEWQMEIVEGVGSNLGGAIDAMRCELSAEAVAFELYEALERIDRLTGKDARRDILGVIFSEFCIGK